MMAAKFVFFLAVSVVFGCHSQSSNSVSDEQMIAACKNALEECAVYVVNPFLLDGGNVTRLIAPESEAGMDMRWFGLGGRTYMHPGSLTPSMTGNIVVPLLSEGFLGTGLYHLEPKVAKNILANSKAFAPRNAFREIVDCWPFEQFDVEDGRSDESLTFYVMANGLVGSGEEEYECRKNGVDWRVDVASQSCKFTAGKMYVYGNALYQLRLNQMGKATDKSISRDRFFIIVNDHSKQKIEAVTIGSYTANVVGRKFSTGKCSTIKSKSPVWNVWSDRSLEEISYPEFPVRVYRSLY